MSIELGADLEIWGPPMGGEAHVHWSIIGFTVGFGSDRMKGVPTIPFPDFEKRLLPKPSSPVPVVRIQPDAGVPEQVPLSLAEKKELAGFAAKTTLNEDQKKKLDDKAMRWIVRPDDFAFSTTSTVPAKQVNVDTGTKAAPKKHQVGPDGKPFAIRPMQLQNVDGEHTVTIFDRGRSQSVDLVQDWECEHQSRALPMALYGAGAPDVKKPTAKGKPLLLDGLLTGLGRAHPKHPEIVGPAAFAMENAFQRLPVVGKEERDTLPLDPGAPAEAASPSRPKKGGVLEKIHATIEATAEDRAELFSALRELGVDPRTDEALDRIAADPGHVFEASPMLEGGS